MEKCIDLLTLTNLSICKDNVVYISIYDSTNDKYYRETIEVHKESRKLNKDHVIERIIEMLLKILK